jgi:hypothetical protein
MTPIESIYDVRLATLIGVAMSAIESLALAKNTDPERILAETLFLINKKVHERGEEEFLMKLNRNYPLLREAIK